MPASFTRLVALTTGPSFRDVAQLQVCHTVPEPGPGQALVRVKHAGVNGGCETFRARGEFWFKANKRLVGDGGFALGAEGSGIIAALGTGCPPSLHIGDAVNFVGGAFAEYVLATASSLWPVPDANPEAVACAISGTTAAVALTVNVGIQPGDTVLVTAAAGATGSFAVQIAVRAGAHVIAVCGGKKKAALCASLGANRVIDHTHESVGEVLARDYGTHGLDVVYEGVGGPMLNAILPHLAPNGRCMIIGYISGYPHTMNGRDAAPLPQNDLTEGLFWSGGTLEIEGGRKLIGTVMPDRAAMLAAKRRLFDDVAAGHIKPVIDTQRQFEGLASVPDAMDYMLSGQAIGKVVVSL